MRKKELIKEQNKLLQEQKKLTLELQEQKKLIQELQEQIDEQCKTIENTMDIFKILVEGGSVSLHIYRDKEPCFFVQPRDAKLIDAKFSKKIYEGLFSRGLLVSNGDVLLDDFASQHYVLRTPKEKSTKE